MDIFHPQDLIWGALAAVIAVCYFVRFRRGQRDVSTMMLWQRVFARRKPWRRWQRPVSLAVQLLIFALLVLAYCEPYWLSTWESARSIVVVIDNSASMNATDVETSRLWQARADVRRLIDDLGPYEELAIVSAGGIVRVPSGFSDDPPSLVRAVKKVRPTDGGNRVSDALTLASQMLRGKRNPQIVLLTDGCVDGAQGIVAQEKVKAVIHSGVASNVGITRFEARPSLVDPLVYDVFCEVGNFGPQPVKCSLETGLKTGAIELSAGQRLPRYFSVSAADDRLLTAKLKCDGADHLIADNQTTIALPARGAISIQVVGPGDPSEGDESYKRLLAALEGLPQAKVEIRAAAAENANGITVFASRVPTVLPPGPVLAIAPQGDCDLWTESGLFEGTIVTSQEDIDTFPHAALLQDVDLRGFVIDAARQYDCATPADTLIRSEGGNAVISAWDRPNGRVLLWHAPLAKTDFTLHDSFPHFIANAVQWLSPRDEVYRPTVKIGDVIVADDGKLVGPVDQVGALSIGSDDENSIVSVNLINARESDLRPSSELGGTELPLANRANQSLLWMTVLLLIVVLLVIEWILYQRRILI
jgi:hypothetical protein